MTQGPSSGTGGASQIGIRVDGGSVQIDGFHVENIAVGIDLNIVNGLNDGFTRLTNLTGGALCTDLVRIQSFVTPNTTVVGMAVPNGCTKTVMNGIPAGTSTTGWIVEDKKY